MKYELIIIGGGSAAFAGALENRMTVQDVVDKIDAYPTMSEMIKLCAQSYFKNIKMLSCCAE